MGYIVRTFVDGIEVATQYDVTDASELKDNEFVSFNKKADLVINGGDVFTGGTDQTKITAQDHQNARDLFENYIFNVLGAPVEDKEVQDAYIEYTIRNRDEYGVRFQTVIPAIERKQPINHEGIIQFNTGVTVKDEGYDPVTALTYYYAGMEAGCEVQRTCTAHEYTGNFDLNANITRAEQQNCIKNGILTFQKIGDNFVILKDINSLVKINAEDNEKKNESFKQNQVVRVVDEIAIQTANVFNSFFLGKITNDDVGRAELKNQLIDIRKYFADIRAIGDYDESLMQLEPGAQPYSVIGSDGILPRNCMEILYFTLSILEN